MQAALKESGFKGKSLAENVAAARKSGILNNEEAAIILSADEARKAVIAVDDFAPEELRRI